MRYILSALFFSSFLIFSRVSECTIGSGYRDVADGHRNYFRFGPEEPDPALVGKFKYPPVLSIFLEGNL